MLITVDGSRTVSDNVAHTCDRCEETIPANKSHLVAYTQSRFSRTRYTFRLCDACVQASNQLVKEVAAHG